MKLSLNWIKEYVDLENLSLEEIKESISVALAEVETIHNLADYYKGILIAQVLDKKPHPNSDKLVVASVKIGDNKVAQVVVGIDNFDINDYVPYTPVGVRVPNNLYPEKFDGLVKDIEIRGVKSEGMLNSEKELKLSDDHTGILIFKPEQFPDKKLIPGLSLIDLLDLDDQIIEIENKSLTHRGDCFSIVGMAREIAAILDRPLKLPPELNYTASQYKTNHIKNLTKPELLFKIANEKNSGCERYSAIAIDKVKFSQSPWWLKIKLLKHDITSVNALVDITNYIMLELGQPMHAFDYDKLQQKGKAEILVRKAKKGESLLGLDHKTHQLTPQTTAITNGLNPIAIGGIIGGESTAISDKTTKVILESATFERFDIRKSSRQLGLMTEAATVFSRQQDPTKTITGLDRALQLIDQFKIGEQASNVTDAYPQPITPASIIISTQTADYFIGEKINQNQISSYLENLNLQVKKIDSDKVEVTPPTFRPDLTIKEDIYEEIARLFGYNKLKLSLPKRTLKPVNLNRKRRFKNKISSVLRAVGLNETIHFNFISGSSYQKAQIETDHCYKITNALSPDVQYMRSLLLPTLIKKTGKNLAHYESFGLFEIGKTYRKDLVYSKTPIQNPIYYPPTHLPKDDQGLPVEDEHICAILAVKENTPDGSPYYLAKKYLEHLIDYLNITQVEYNHLSEFSKKAVKEIPIWLSTALNSYHPGRTAIVTANIENKNIYLGLAGELHPQVLKNFKLPNYIAAFELQLHLLSRLNNQIGSFQAPSKYPMVEQDLCFIADESVTYEALTKAVYQVNPDPKLMAGENLIKSITPIDIYQDKNLKGKKQITIRVQLQSDHQTLKQKDIEEIKNKIINSVKKQTGANLKS